MATCPRCKGPLTDDHRCPRGRVRPAAERSLVLLAGGVLGVLACYGLIDRPHGAVVLAAGALGALLLNAFIQAVRSA
jgi:hypothetical protein